MVHQKKRINKLILYFVIFLFSTNVYASKRLVSNKLLEFSLIIENKRTQFNFSGSNQKAHFNILGVNWYESFSPAFQGGLEIGYFEMTQINNNLPSARFTFGEYVGVNLRYFLVDNDTLSLNLNLNYRYSSSTKKLLDQQTNFVWHKGGLLAEIQLHISDKSSILLASEYQLIDGEQRDSGNITQINEFKENQRLGYRLGLNFTPSKNGYISLELLAGISNGGRINFTRKF